jgi:hypothetical protein
MSQEKEYLDRNVKKKYISDPFSLACLGPNSVEAEYNAKFWGFAVV